MLIAVDHGNHAIKTVHYNFISGLAQHSVRPPMAEEVLEYKGEYWTASVSRTAGIRLVMKVSSSSPCSPLPKSLPMPALYLPRKKSSWQSACPRSITAF